MASRITVTATEANRSFSKLLRVAQQGARVTITSQGRPVAELVPVAAVSDDKFEADRAELLAHWASLPVIRIEPWTREELYDRNA